MEKQHPRGLMTSGPIVWQILAFAIPLLIGNLFQQFYNAVDSAVVGRYLGENALVAGALMTVLGVTFLSSCSSGAWLVWLSPR